MLLTRAEERHDTVQYFYSLGMLLRMILDFESYKSSGASFISIPTDADFKIDYNSQTVEDEFQFDQDEDLDQ